MSHWKTGVISRGAKRVLDIVGSLTLLVSTLPLCAVAAIAIRSVSRGPVLFRQQRVGRDRRPFEMLKFRTMHVHASDLLAIHLARDPDAADEWRRFRRLRHDPRVLPFVGRLLRASSIDELPQLWNVLAGDMSLVGPRPLEIAVEQRFDARLMEQRGRVRPGLTGLWQVSGRSELDLDTLVSMDTSYVEQWSLWSDLVILWQTPRALLSRRGAY